MACTMRGMSDNTERTLMATDDAMVWAQEFCRIFDGFVIEGGNEAAGFVNEGGMVGWFANAMVVAVVKHEERRLQAQPVFDEEQPS